MLQHLDPIARYPDTFFRKVIDDYMDEQNYPSGVANVQAIIPMGLRWEYELNSETYSHDLAFSEDLLTFDEVRTRPVSDRECGRCLRDLLNISYRIPDVPTRDDIEHLAVPFLSRWGLKRDRSQFFGGHFIGAQEVFQDSRTLRSLLRVFLETERECRALADDVWALRWYTSDRIRIFNLDEPSGPLPPRIRAINESSIKRRMVDEFLSLQREIIANSLRGFLFNPQDDPDLGYWDETAQPSLITEFVWDENGRRIAYSGSGYGAMVQSKLLSMFQSDQINLDICSICGSIFERDPDQRRPRPKDRRYCSSKCRQEGKRAANRATWHRHKHRWKKQGGKDA